MSARKCLWSNFVCSHQLHDERSRARCLAPLCFPPPQSCPSLPELPGKSPSEDPFWDPYGDIRKGRTFRAADLCLAVVIIKMRWARFRKNAASRRKKNLKVLQFDQLITLRHETAAKTVDSVIIGPMEYVRCHSIFVIRKR